MSSKTKGSTRKVEGTAKADALIVELRQKGKSWVEISQRLPGRTILELFHPYYSRENKKDTASGGRRSSTGSKQWAAEETALLLELQQDGLSWDEISEHIPGRSSGACKSQFSNQSRFRGWNLDGGVDANVGRGGRLRSSIHKNAVEEDPASTQLRAEADEGERRRSTSLSALAASRAEPAPSLKMPKRPQQAATKTVAPSRKPAKRKRQTFMTTSRARKRQKSARRANDDIAAGRLARAQNEDSDNELEAASTAAVKLWALPASSPLSRRTIAAEENAGDIEAEQPPDDEHQQAQAEDQGPPLFVNGDSDQNIEAEEPASAVKTRGQRKKPVPSPRPGAKKRGRPRKSDPSTGAIDDGDNDHDITIERPASTVKDAARPGSSRPTVSDKSLTGRNKPSGSSRDDSLPQQRARTVSQPTRRLERAGRTSVLGQNRNKLIHGTHARRSMRDPQTAEADIFEIPESDHEAEIDGNDVQRGAEEEESSDAYEDDEPALGQDDMNLSDIPGSNIIDTAGLWRKLSLSDFNDIFENSREYLRHLKRNNSHRDKDEISDSIKIFKQESKRAAEEIYRLIDQSDSTLITSASDWSRVNKTVDALQRTFWSTLIEGTTAIAQQFYENLFLDLVGLFRAAAGLYTHMEEDEAKVKSLELILSISGLIVDFCERVRKWKFKVDSTLAIVKPARHICKMIRDLGPLVKSEIKTVESDILKEKRHLRSLQDEETIEDQRARQIKQKEHDMKMNRLNYFLTERYRIQSYDRSIATYRFQPRLQQPPSNSRFAVDANGDAYEREDVFTARRPGSAAPGKELNIPAIKWELSESLILIDAVVKFHDHPMMWKAIMKEYCGYMCPLTHRTFLELLFEAKRLQRVYEYNVAATGNPTGKLSYFQDLQDMDLYDLYYP